VTPLLATIHPAFVLRSKRWRPILESDIAKAVRHARGVLQWRDPAIVLDPTVSDLDAALRRFAGSPVATDTETDGLDPERCALRCVGLCNKEIGIAVGFRSVETPLRKWRLDPDRGRERLRNFFSKARLDGGPSKLILHNQVFDQPIFERHGMPIGDPSSVVDTVLLHKSADSELPHDLSFLSSILTDAPSWKPDHDHDAWASDLDLHRYCILDCAVTARIFEPLAQEVKASGQIQVYRGDLELQRLAIGFHRAGIAIDEEEQKRHSVRLGILMQAARDRASCVVQINIASDDQVRRYLFETRRMLAPSTGGERGDGYTKLGDPSVDKDALYDILKRDLRFDDRAFIDAILDFRRAQKAKSSFVDNLEVQEGRVHAVWNAHSNKSGRMSCSEPNLQTIPDKRQDPDSLRSMFCAAPGCALVGADYDQIHMRIVAARAPITAWLETFERQARGAVGPSADIHSVNAGLFFNKRPQDVQKYERTVCKTITYALVYGAGVKTFLAQMARVRDPVTGERPYARWSFVEGKSERNKFLRTYPELGVWWDREMAAWRAGGSIRSMIHGRLLRLRDLVGSDSEEGRSDVVNGAVLMTEADIAGGNGASGKAARAIGWPWYGSGRGLGGAGLLMHIHDALYCEVAAGREAEAKARLRESMETTLKWNGREVRITATPKAGQKWSELG
jgi:DNA polymerase-1